MPGVHDGSQEERLPVPTIATATASSTRRTHAPTCPASPTTIPRRTAARPIATATASSTRTTPAPTCPASPAPIRRRTAARRTPTATASPTTRTLARLEPGRPNADPTKNGCPTVFVRGGSIVILEQVQFKTGSDFILPASDELLTNVNKIFIGHPEITMVAHRRPHRQSRRQGLQPRPLRAPRGEREEVARPARRRRQAPPIEGLRAHASPSATTRRTRGAR